jgi:hypothetical protein
MIVLTILRVEGKRTTFIVKDDNKVVFQSFKRKDAMDFMAALVAIRDAAKVAA